MNRKLTTLVLICAVLWVSCASSVHGEGIVIDHTLIHDGIERSFLLYQPSSYSDQQNWPLVLNLHGVGSNANEQMPFTGMNEVAEAEGFLVAYPNAINGDWLGPEDNVGFIDAVIDSVEQMHRVSDSHVYVTGMSQGAYFSRVVATELSNTFAAAALVSSHSAPVEVFPLESFRPFPLLEIHGTADIVVPYEGGDSQVIPGLVFPPVSDFLAAWAENNGADPEPDITELPDVFPDDESTVSLLSFENADTYTGVSGTEIPAELLHYRVNGGGHSWPLDPSLRHSGGPDFLYPLNSDINASAVIWGFFSGHELAVVVPEPSCVLLAVLPCISLAALALQRRRFDRE